MRSLGHVLASLLLGACGARSGLDLGDRDSGVAAPETCDGRDEDLDGLVDEGLPPLVCGTGSCAREVPSCEDGHPVVCPPIVPTEEICNRLDDDCDGQIDEGLGFGPIGDPIVIREVGAERIGECSTCAVVLNAQLATFGRELHAVWNLDFGGFIDVPNTYARHLGDDGVPLQPSRPLFSALTTGISLAPSHSGYTMASFCQRLEDRRDYPRSQLLDERGERVGEVLLRAYADQPCRDLPSALWMGEVHLFLRARWRAAVLEIADRDGRSLRHSEIELAWATTDGRRIAFDGRRATFAYHQSRERGRSNELALLELDTSGEVAFSEVFPLPPGRARWRSEMAVLADEAGPLLAALSTAREPGVLGLSRFDRDHETLQVIAEIDVEPASDVVLHRRSRDEIVAVLSGGGRDLPHLEVLSLSEEGDVLGRWMLDTTGGDLRSTRVHSHIGGVFLSYVRQLDRVSTTVEVLELGCVP